MIVLNKKKSKLPLMALFVFLLLALAFFATIKTNGSSVHELLEKLDLQILNKNINNEYPEGSINKPLEKSNNQLLIDKQKNILSEKDSQSSHGNNVDPELRYRKVLALMSSSVHNLTEVEKEKVIEKVLIELPLVVRDGKMHPYHAVIAHTILLERQNKPADAAMLKEIERQYKSLYPHHLNVDNTPHLY